MMISFLKDIFCCSTVDILQSELLSQVTEQELLQTLADAQSESATREGKNMDRGEWDKRTLRAVEGLITYHRYTLSSIAVHLTTLNDRPRVWLHGVPVADGWIAIDTLTKFAKHRALRIFFGTLKEFRDAKLNDDLTDVGFDRKK